MAKKKKPTKAPKAKSVKPVKSTKVAKPAKKAVVKKEAKKEKVAKKAPVPSKKQAQVKPAKKMEPKKSVKPIAPKKAMAAVKKTAAPAKEKIEAPKVSKKVKNQDEDLERESTSTVAERPAERDVYLTDAEGRRLCKVKDCDQLSAVEFYCRYHYLLFWKKIQNRKKILSEGKLEQYIEELTSRYPIKFLELIRKDLHTEADFMSAIQELDIDESSNLDEFEEDENFIDEVRGISSDSGDRTDDEF